MALAETGETSETVIEEVVEGQPAEAAEDDDLVEVTLGGDSPPAEEEEEKSAPQWVKNLRVENREKDRKIRELEQKLTPLPVTPELGKKPTLEDSGYDEDDFESKLDAWKARKATIETKAEEKRKEDETAQTVWSTKLQSYNTAKTGLKVKDFDDAEAAATAALSVVQQGILVKGATNPATLVYALGKNPKRLQELASIKDPVEFAFAAARLESEMKVTPRKAAPLPEKVVSGNASTSGSVDSTLSRLQAEADKSGDRTAVIAYKRKLKDAK